MNHAQQFLRRSTSRSGSRAPIQDPALERDATTEGAQAMGRGADFSGVRVHNDAAAAREADALGAHAFTSGQDIYLGSGVQQSAAAVPLLVHELGHVVQQDASGPAVQCQPKGPQGGIGATPPDEDFIKDPDSWGSEDAHVLFNQNDDALDGDAETVIKKAVAGIKEASYVHVHGYASREGPGEFNLNLSAHRGVQVKHVLEKLLPAGSKVYVFAHGESRHFGAAKENRRTGISVMGTVAEGGYHPKWNFDLGSGPLVTPRGITVVDTPSGSGSGGIPPIVLDPTKFGLARPPYLKPIAPLTTPRHLMTNADIVNPSALHGVGASETGNIVDLWDSAYWKYHNLGIPDELKLGPIDLGAGELANKEVKNSIQAYHERNDPTIIEKSNQDVGAHVFMSPNLLELFSSKKKDKK